MHNFCEKLDLRHAQILGVCPDWHTRNSGTERVILVPFTTGTYVQKHPLTRKLFSVESRETAVDMYRKLIKTWVARL